MRSSCCNNSPLHRSAVEGGGGVQIRSTRDGRKSLCVAVPPRSRPASATARRADRAGHPSRARRPQTPFSPTSSHGAEDEHRASQLGGEGGGGAMSSSRGRERCVMHIDLDAFYCAVEAERDPALRGLPLGVRPTPSLPPD